MFCRKFLAEDYFKLWLEWNESDVIFPPYSAPRWPLQHDGSLQASMVSSGGGVFLAGFSQID